METTYEREFQPTYSQAYHNHKLASQYSNLARERDEVGQLISGDTDKKHRHPRQRTSSCQTEVVRVAIPPQGQQPQNQSQAQAQGYYNYSNNNLNQQNFSNIPSFSNNSNVKRCYELPAYLSQPQDTAVPYVILDECPIPGLQSVGLSTASFARVNPNQPPQQPQTPYMQQWASGPASYANMQRSQCGPNNWNGPNQDLQHPPGSIYATQQLHHSPAQQMMGNNKASWTQGPYQVGSKR